MTSMKYTIVIAAVLAGFLLVGAGAADGTETLVVDDDQLVYAVIDATGVEKASSSGSYTATISAPIDVPLWRLEREGTNELFVGTVEISTTSPEGVMSLSVTADCSEWGFNAPLQVKSDEYSDCPDWVNLICSTPQPLFFTDADPEAFPVGIYLKQPVDLTDLAGDYVLRLSYTLEVIPDGLP